MEGSFAWGWDALVAIGTLALAFGTVFLAWGTRQVARATGEEIRSQWRPVIAPGADVEVEYLEEGGVTGKGVAILAIQNIGRGAAYAVDAGLDLGETVVPVSPWGLVDSEPRNLTALPSQDSCDLYFDSLDVRPGRSVLVIDYQDLNGRRYASRIQIDDSRSWTRPGVDVLRMDRVELFVDHELIPWKAPRGRLKYGWFRLSEWWRWRRRKTDDYVEF